MKEKLIHPALFLLGFILGSLIFCNISHYGDTQYIKTIEEEIEYLEDTNEFKRELLEYSLSAMYKAEYLMNKHNMWDIDGSDEMADYMQYYEKADSMVCINL